MVSSVKYPKWPRIGFRNARGIIALILHVVIIGGAILVPSSFLFPFCIGYAAFGVLRFALYSVLERQDRLALRSAESSQSMEDHSR
jgi:phosphatidylserine synthase